MGDIVRDGVSIHFEVVGEGEPVLLMHGGYVSSEYWRRAGYVRALSEDHKVVLLDFRGHGASSRPREQDAYGLNHDVADALAAINASGVESATVCGWSWGGTTGLALAALHPLRVRGVLAVSASGRHGRFSDLAASLPWAADAARRFEHEGVMPIADEIASLGGASWLRDAVVQNDPLALAAWCRAQRDGKPIGVALTDVTQPVLFMPGELELERLAFPDPLLPRHARLRVISGANHVTAFLHVEDVIAGLHEVMT